jgi:hypothetical protein
MLSTNHKLLRIGIFYDGDYFRRVSNYYASVHPRRARISIEGLHNFVPSSARVPPPRKASAPSSRRSWTRTISAGA